MDVIIALDAWSPGRTFGFGSLYCVDISRRAKDPHFPLPRASENAKALGDGLFELRHIGKLNTRVLWFFVKGRRIIAVHGIRNKGQAIPARDLDTAQDRMRDWEERIET